MFSLFDSLTDSTVHDLAVVALAVFSAASHVITLSLVGVFVAMLARRVCIILCTAYRARKAQHTATVPATPAEPHWFRGDLDAPDFARFRAVPAPVCQGCGNREYARPSDVSAGHVHSEPATDDLAENTDMNVSAWSAALSQPTEPERPTIDIWADYLGHDARIGYGSHIHGRQVCGGVIVDTPSGPVKIDGGELWHRDVSVQPSSSAPIAPSIGGAESTGNV